MDKMFETTVCEALDIIKKGQQSLKNEGKMNQDHNYVEIRW